MNDPRVTGSSNPRARSVTTYEASRTTRASITEPEFRDLLVAMVEYGASLEATEIELLVVYLTETYGKRDP